MTDLTYAQKINREWHGQYFIEYAQVQLKQASIDLEKGDIAGYKACLSEVATSLKELAEIEERN